MSGPWEKYQAANDAPAVAPGGGKPWEKFRGAAPAPVAPAPPPAPATDYSHVPGIDETPLRPDAADRPRPSVTPGDLLRAPLSAASTIPSGMAQTVAGVAGNVAELVGAEPGTGERWRQNAREAIEIPYPESLVIPGAPQAEEAIGRGIAAVPGAAPVLEAAGDAANLLGLGAGVGGAARTIARTAAERGVIADGAAVAGARTPQELVDVGGFRVRPHDFERAGDPTSVTDKLLQGVSGPALKREDILHNLDRTQALATQELGIGDLSDEALAAAKAPHAAVYDAINAYPQVMFDDEFKRSALGVGQDSNTMLRLPAGVNELRADILGHEGASGAQFRTTIGDLRAKAKDNLATEPGVSPTPRNRDLGNAQVEMAHALEDMMARGLPPELAAMYPEARRAFAKIGTVERARVGGRLDPRAIMREAQVNKGVDGNLRIIADLAERYPEVFNIDVPQPGSGTLDHALRVAAGMGTVGLSEGVPMLARKLLNRGGVPDVPMSESAPSFFRGPADMGPVGPPSPSADDLLATQLQRGTPTDSLPFADQILADDAMASANRSPLDEPFLNAPDPAPLPGAVPTDQPVRASGSFADLMAELQGSAEAPAPLASMSDLMELGGAPPRDMGGFSFADVIGGDHSIAPEPFRPAPGDVVRADRNMAPRDLTAGSTTGQLTPTDIFDGGMPFADVLDQGGTSLQREAFRPGAGDTVPFRKGESAPEPELSLADYQPQREGLDPSSSIADALSGDLELSPTPRGAPAELSLEPSDGFERSFADELTDAPQTLKATKPKKPAGDVQRLENVQKPIIKDRHVEPGSTVFLRGSKQKPKAYLSVKPGEKSIDINGAWVDEGSRGEGIGQQQLLDAVDYAAEKGLPLNSDKTVTTDQLRVYEKLRDKGELEFDYADPDAVKKALAGEGDKVVKGKGGSVITNIRRPKLDDGGLSFADALAD